MADAAQIQKSVSTQYQNASNLEARIALHERFSTASQRWPFWVFDQLTLPPSCRILELGCGPGVLWHENKDRIPPGWTAVLSDQSPGMIARARQQLSTLNQSFCFAVVNADAVPLADGTFDVIIANHMLYHVPDLARALSEIKRVLKPGGVLYAATNGVNHMRELDELAPKQIPFSPVGEVTSSFTLENGAALLRPYFSTVSLHRYEDGLLVTEAAPIVDYVLSRISLYSDQAPPGEDERKIFLDDVQTRLDEQDGTVRITKDSGLFIAAQN